VTRLAPFALHRPETLPEATALLLELGDDAAVHAGGTEVLLLMKLGLAGFGHLVDVKRIAELAGVSVREDGTLRVGATATHRQVGRSPMVRAGWPELASIEGQVANVRVRSVGTLGGNLCFADPHSDPATWLLVAEARLELGLADARRTLGVADFLRGPWETALEPGELLVAIEVPPVPSGASMTHVRFATHERPTATVSCLARVSEGVVAEARIAVGSVGPRPVRVPRAEAIVLGLDALRPDLAAIDAAGAEAATASEPDSDSNGSADYKADLVRVLTGRALQRVIASSIAPQA
jgi:carbon-monoxide dehydrogenase medium subunit